MILATSLLVDAGFLVQEGQKGFKNSPLLLLRTLSLKEYTILNRVFLPIQERTLVTAQALADSSKALQTLFSIVVSDVLRLPATLRTLPKKDQAQTT